MSLQKNVEQVSCCLMELGKLGDCKEGGLGVEKY